MKNMKIMTSFFSLLNGKACEDRIINKEFDKLKYEKKFTRCKDEQVGILF